MAIFTTPLVLDSLSLSGSFQSNGFSTFNNVSVGGTLAVVGVASFNGAANFTISPSVPTPAASDNSLTVPNTSWVTSTVAGAITNASQAAAITGGSIDGTAVGATTPTTGKFTTLVATGTSTLAATTFGSNSVTGSNFVLSGGSINGMAIGSSTASSGKFTTLSTTGVASMGAALTVTGVATFNASVSINSSFNLTGGANAIMNYTSSGATADQGKWRMYASTTGNFFFQAQSDDASTNTNVFYVTRSGATPGSMILAVPLTVQGNLTVNGSTAFGANLVSGSNVALTGGTINATTIGATTPSTGSFTNLIATGSTSVPTVAPTDSSSAIANTAWVTQALSGAINGLQIKVTATVATAAPLPAYTASGSVLTASANAALVVDGYTVQVNDLVLVLSETGSSAAYNGLYVVVATGGSSAAYSLTRHADMNDPSEFSGAFVPVGNLGTSNANSLWLCNPVGTVVVGTTAIPFSQLNGATDILAGLGIQINGNTISAAIAGIIGGSIDGAAIGASTPSTAQFTTLAASGASSFTSSVSFTGTTTAPTATAGDSSTKIATTAFVGAAISTVQTGVAITGGTINGTAIGSTTPSSGAFTTVTASGGVTLSNSLSVNGGAALNSNVNVGGTLAVTGTSTFSTTNIGGILTITTPGGAGIHLDNLTAGRQSAMAFYDAGAVQWQMGKQTDNSFFLYDVVAAQSMITASGGTINFPCTTTAVGGTLAVGGATTLASTLTVSGATKASASVTVDATGAQFISRGYMLYSDTNNFSVLLSGSQTPTATFNSLRPISISLSSGAIGINTPLTSTSTISVTGTTFILGSNAGGSAISYLNAASGTYRQHQFLTAGSTRWIVGTDNGAESAVVTLTTSAAQSAAGTVLNFASTSGVAVGQYVYGTGIPSGATVVSFVANTSVTLSVATTAVVASGASIQFCTNAGSGFFFNAYADNGTYTGRPINISRTTGNVTLSGVLNVASTVASTSPSTGALTVAGGVGINGATQIYGALTAYAATVLGGTLGVTGVASFGAGVSFPNGAYLDTASTFLYLRAPGTTGTLVVTTNGGAGAGNLIINNINASNINATGTLAITGAATFGANGFTSGSSLTCTNANAIIMPVNTSNELHPWLATRTVSGSTTANVYPYITAAANSSVGVYDSAAGTIWNFNYATNIFSTQSLSVGSALTVLGGSTISGTANFQSIVNMNSASNTLNFAVAANYSNISDYSTAGGNIFFDVCRGTTSHGGYVWRSSSANTVRMALDTTGNLTLYNGLTMISGNISATGSRLAQSATSAEQHSWEVTRNVASGSTAIVYQYVSPGNNSALGIYDTYAGNVWNYNFSSGTFTTQSITAQGQITASGQIAATGSTGGFTAYDRGGNSNGNGTFYRTGGINRLYDSAGGDIITYTGNSVSLLAPTFVSGTLRVSDVLTAPTFVSTANTGIALQMGPNAAIRDVSNGASNMYFDVSVGGTANGQWIWRSSSSYTTRMTLDTSANLTVAGNVYTNSLIVNGNTVVNGNQIYLQSGTLFVANGGTGNVILSNSSAFTSVLGEFRIAGTTKFSTAGTTVAQIDTSGAPISIPANTSVVLPTGSGMVILNDSNTYGAVGVFVMGGGAVGLIGSNLNAYSVGQPSASSNKTHVYYDGSVYRIHNGNANAITLTVTYICTRGVN